MQNLLISTAAAITLAAGAIGLAATASAAPSGSPAADTIADLRAQGYTVQVNGTRNGPLSNCSVEAVRGTSNEAPGATVYVDLSCPAEYQY